MKTETLCIIISPSDCSAKGLRADQFLSKKEGLPSRSQLKVWFTESRIKRIRNSVLELLRPSSILLPGDKISIDAPPPRTMNIKARPLKLKIFFEDEDLIVLHKPKGLSMHPGAGNSEQTTLVHGLLAHSSSLSSPDSPYFRPGIVHRLDKDTEGIVVIAKNNEVHEFLSKQFSNRTIDRAYWALSYGKVPQYLEIDAPIGRHPKERKKMAVVRNGKPSQTLVRLLQYFEEGYSWLECKLLSGRTHQIRVHLSYKGHAILGDPVYASRRKLSSLANKKREAFESLRGQALVAFRLGFIHPRNQKKMLFEIETPEWMRPLLKIL